MFAVMAFTAQTSAQSADIPSIGFCGNTLYISNGTKNPKDLRFKALINNKANVLSDMLSDSIKYKDFQSTYFLCIIYMYEFRIENPYTQISRYISLVATYPVVQAVCTICVKNRIDHGFCKNALTQEEADPQLRMRLKLLTEDNIYC
mgnify:CR=1 FL=1